MRIPWQERATQSTSTDGPPSVSGLVLFYDPEQTAEYKSLIEKAVFNGLHYTPMSINAKAIAKFTLHWAEVPALDANDSDTLSALQTKFQTMLTNHEFSTGLRSDSFLYMDKEGMCLTRPYVWLGEPVPSLDTEKTTTEPRVDKQGEVRPLKVDIKHIAPTLFVGWSNGTS